ncbi:MAG: radical SAM protein [bacterium]
MKKIEAYTGYEMGPIRPPSEANSLLIRVTRNCPWNRCTFCPVYKDEKFSRRPLDHVLQDIDTLHHYVTTLLDTQKSGNRMTTWRELAGQSHPDDALDRTAYYTARNFVAHGMQSVFLQDGNSLNIKPHDLVRILKRLKEAFPEIKRITSYARSKTVAKIEDEDLRRIADAGLNRIHIGMESGSDKVLEAVKKGSDKATQILAGQKVKRAGMELSEYIIPGLGGRTLSREHALESADALNQINPDFIRLRTLALPDGAPLTSQYREGHFDKMGDIETTQELLLFLESLRGITSSVKSDHTLNLFTEVEGRLPDDRGHMIAPLQEFLQLDRHEQMVFCIGRRTHRLAHLSDLNNPVRRGYAEQICHELGATPETMDGIIDTIMKQFI